MMRTAFVKLIIAAAAVVAAGTAAASGPVPGQGTWESTLSARYFDGDPVVDAYYDSALNITWLADANLLGEAVDFAAATGWASSLNLGGVTGWTLPTINIDTCQSDSSFWNGGGVCGYGVLPGTSDMAHLNLITLGNPSYSGYTDYYGNGPGIPEGQNLLVNTGPFRNLQGLGYWFSKDYSMFQGNVESHMGWRYSFHAGRQDPMGKDSNLLAWAVHQGDVGALAPVPEPETYSMMLAGLGAMVLVARRRRNG